MYAAGGRNIALNSFYRGLFGTLILQKYKKQTEAAKKEYLKLLADYKASLVSRVSDVNCS
jgi:hypothetical protein